MRRSKDEWDDREDEDDELDENESDDEDDSECSISYTLTNQSLSISCDGKNYSFQKGAPNFAILAQALDNKDWTTVRANLDVRGAVKCWTDGKFTYTGAELLYDNTPVPASFTNRVLAMMAKNESVKPLLRFYERLQQNPSWRSVQQLFTFLQHSNIPILPDGCFLAYKGVNPDYTDVHTGKINNRPGTTHNMPRNQISDDPDVPCHFGFHVGSHRYAVGFGTRVVVCKIDPMNVVCVPKDEECQKVRVCEYTVVGHYGQPLPSTVMEDVEIPKTKNADEPEFGPPLTAAELMDMPMDELRRTAVQDLKIVGARSIQGGKAVLVAKILEVMRGGGKG